MLTDCPHLIQRARRPILIERHLLWICEEIVADIGWWLARRWKAVKQKEWYANADINRSGKSQEYLRAQWDIQKPTQLSVRGRMSFIAVRPAVN